MASKSKHKLNALTEDDMRADGYTLFPDRAVVGPKVLDVWERQSHIGVGWQYLVCFQTPVKELRVLNAEAPLNRIPDVMTLGELLLSTKVLRKKPRNAYDWAFSINDEPDLAGNFTAASFRDRAVDETLMHHRFKNDDVIAVYEIEANGDQPDTSRSFEPDDWFENESPQLNEKSLGSLKFSILSGSLDDVQYVLDETQDDDQAELSRQMGHRPLHFCAWLGHAAMVSALVEAGHDPNAVDAHGHTAMHYAAAQGDEAMCLALYKNGADPLRFNALGQTPLAMSQAVGRADDLYLLRTLVSGLTARAVLKEMLAPPSDTFAP